MRKQNFFVKSLEAVALLPVYFYRFFLKPLLPQSCAYFPTCSEYAILAIKKHGIFKGWWLATKRILRCNPFNRKAFGYDPVPGTELDIEI